MKKRVYFDKFGEMKFVWRDEIYLPLRFTEIF